MHRLLLPLLLLAVLLWPRSALADEPAVILDDRTGLTSAEITLVETCIRGYAENDGVGAYRASMELVASLTKRDGPAARRGDAHLAMGNLAARGGDVAAGIRSTEAAIAAYSESAELKEDLSRATTALASFRLMNREVDAALELDRKAIALAKEAHPDGHGVVVRAISVHAIRLWNLGRREQAVEVMFEAVQVARRCLDDKDPQLHGALSSYGVLLQWVRRHEESLALEIEALRLQRIDGLPDPGPGMEQLFRGRAQVMGGRVEEGIETLERAVETLGAAFPDGHVKLVTALESVGAGYQRVGRHRDAVDALDRALAVHESLETGTASTRAGILQVLADNLVQTGDLPGALARASEAVELASYLYPVANPSWARALGTLGYAQLASGQTEEAIESLQRSTEMFRALGAERDPNFLIIASSLATALSNVGRDEESKRWRAETLRLAERQGPAGDKAIAGLLVIEAVELRHQGDHDGSVKASEKALEHGKRGFGEDDPELINILDVLARSYELAGRADDARRTLDAVIEMGRRLEWRYLYAALYRATTAALREERIEDAEALAEEGVRRFEGLLESARGLSTEGRVQALADLRRQAHPYKALAEVRLTQGRVADALEVLESGRSHTLLGLLAESREDPLRRAFAMAKERGDDALVRRIGDAEATVRAANARLVEAQRGEERARASRKLAEVRAARAEVTASRQAVADAVRARHFVLRDVLPAAKPRTVEEIRSLLGPTERMLVLFRGDDWVWSFLVRPDGADVPVDVWRSEFDAADVERYVNALATKGGIDTPLHRKTGGLLFSRLVSDAAWKELQGASRVFVSPHDDLNRLPFEALVVGSDRDGPRYWLDDGPPISYVASGSVLAWLRERRTTSDQLGTGLVAVGDPEFEAKSVHWPRVGVLVVEVEDDGQAARLGLRVGDVIARYGRTSVSARDALEKAEQAPGAEGKTPLQIYRDGAPQTLQADGGALGVQVADEPPHVSGPKLIEAARAEVGGTERAGRLQRLPGTAKEVRAIRVVAKRLGDELPVTTILGAEAHEARVFEAARGCRILHVATHGLVSEKQSASFSALALAPPAVPVPGNDGFLSLGDLLERWRGHLDGCELVVLSACESQRGTLDRHEGMLALPWGFCFAGSPTVVGSLWKVDDASTAELMKAFYESLLGPDSPDKDHSLHAARRALRERFPDPYYWAPFVLLGDPVRDTDER